MIQCGKKMPARSPFARGRVAAARLARGSRAPSRRRRTLGPTDYAATFTVRPDAMLS